MLLGVIVLFSRQEFIITPFEMQALQYVATAHERVFSVVPHGTPIYKAVKPLLYDFPEARAMLTGVSTTVVCGSK